MTVRLDSLLREIPATLETPGREAIEITAVVHDSRAVVPGALFCCVRGASVDGHDLIDEARDRGARAVLVDRDVETDLARVRVVAVRDALGPVSAAFFGHPSDGLVVVAVTGTSGKTTTTHLLGSVLEAHGWPTAVLGTISGPRTTPEAPELQAELARVRDSGGRAVAMEVSSHALAMGRVRATHFAVAVFTNLSHDHLDFHRDMEDYFETKAALFTPAYTAAAVVNLDDPRGAEIARRALVPTEGYSLAEATDLSLSATRCTFRWRGEEVELPLGGRFNVSNALAAATAAATVGVPTGTIAAGLRHAAAVPGRFEPVDEGQPFAVVVDYAHKPGALTSVLSAAREAAAGGRVLLVFGAGGDRDRSKRPAMGEVASRLADRVVLTSDNPRSEDPMAIIEAIRGGMRAAAPVIVEPDRAAAIAVAIDEALPGDVVVIAGKGHETVQVAADRTIDFDDRTVARAALRALRGSGRW